jgi:hypothetical protein
MEHSSQSHSKGFQQTNLIDRVKNIIITPATEWEVIKSETPDIKKIITGYVLPLAGAAAVAAFIGYSFIGADYGFVRTKGLDWGLYQALTILISAVLSVFISAFVIDALAPTFNSEKNFPRSVQLMAYSSTPAWLGGLFAIIPSIALIGSLFGLYSLYLLYIGLPKLKNTPADKNTTYFMFAIIILILVYFAIFWLFGRLLLSIFGLSYGTPGVY